MPNAAAMRPTGSSDEAREEVLGALRQQVEQISQRLLIELNARARTVMDVAALKREYGFPLRDQGREEVLLERLTGANPGPLDDATIRMLFSTVIDACVRTVGGDAGRQLRVSPASGPPIVVNVAGASFGPGTTEWIAGPCSVENEEQMEAAAASLARSGVRLLRGGAFKPRTSPYAFQGLGEPGLELLSAAARRHKMGCITEATSPQNVDCVARHADMIQIGSRNMANFELLRAAGACRMPVLLKRGFGATVEEWIHAAEYLAVAGTDQIVLCERGIRTFTQDTRNTLDLSAVPLAQARARLPVVVDVSHAAGRRDILIPLASAAFGAGARGVMVEVHPDPDHALSDSDQQVTPAAFDQIRRGVAEELARLARALHIGPRSDPPPPSSTRRSPPCD